MGIIALIMVIITFVATIILLSLIYWAVILIASALLNLIFYFIFKRVDKWRLIFVFISCCLPYLTLWGLITGRGSLSNMFENPIYLALIMTVLEAIYLLTGKYVKSYNHNIALNILYLLTSFVVVILFTAYMPELPE